MLGQTLTDVEPDLKEMLVYYMVASMIRDGILQSRYITLKSKFGCIVLFASIDFDSKEQAGNKRYELEVGWHYHDRTLELIQNYRSKKIKTQF